MKKATTLIFTLALVLAFVAAPYTLMAGQGCSSSAVKTANAAGKSCSASSASADVKTVNSKSCSAECLKTCSVSGKSCSALGNANKTIDGTIKSASATADAAEAKFATATFNVKGMTCGGCESMVTKALKNYDGVASVDKVCHKSGTAMVTYDPSAVSCPSKLAGVISESGFKAEVAEMDKIDKASEKFEDTKKNMTNAGNSSL